MFDNFSESEQES